MPGGRDSLGWQVNWQEEDKYQYEDCEDLRKTVEMQEISACETGNKS